jgi:hypothetical protein
MQLLDIHLGRPITRGALTVFPLWNGAAVASRGDDVSSADLTVEERAGLAVVTELIVTNNGRRPVLVLEGELLEGGQQHRTWQRVRDLEARHGGGGTHFLGDALNLSWRGRTLHAVAINPRHDLVAA